MTWREELLDACETTGEVFARLTITLTEEELDVEFDAGYGSPNGGNFTAWGDRFVYFPVCYDGKEWVAWVPRHPCPIKMHHQGGW